jgi:hypothetical protein
MKAKEGWRRHLVELVNAGLGPRDYAVQWAHDPRYVQRNTGHRRIGALSESRMPVCRWWLEAGRV